VAARAAAAVAGKARAAAAGSDRAMAVAARVAEAVMVRAAGGKAAAAKMEVEEEVTRGTRRRRYDLHIEYHSTCLAHHSN